MSGPLPRNFGWKAHKLAEHSLEDLGRLRLAVEQDPASANPDRSSIYLYSKAARRKLDALAWAVYHKQRAQRAASPEAA